TPGLRVEASQRHSGHILRQRERRFLPLPEHQRPGHEILRLLRPPARRGEGRRRARRGVWSRRLHPPQLRDEHGQYREGFGPHRAICPAPGSMNLDIAQKERFALRRKKPLANSVRGVPTILSPEIKRGRQSWRGVADWG